jgi:hypothetical protein
MSTPEVITAIIFCTALYMAAGIGLSQLLAPFEDPVAEAITFAVLWPGLTLVVVTRTAIKMVRRWLNE